MLLSGIPTKFSIPFGKNAANIRQVPTASQIGIQAGAASLNDGFPPLNFQAIAAGGVPPFGQDVNGILNQITLWNQWQQAGAPVLYDNAFATAIGGYPQGATLQQLSGGPGTYWVNQVDGNTSNPDTGGSNWVSWSISNLKAAAIEFQVGDGQNVINSNTKAWLEIPFPCVIQRWTMLADQSGSAVFDLWKVPFSNYPPNSGNTITGGAPPALSAAQRNQSSNLVGWTTSINAGDVLELNVTSASSVMKVTLSLYVLRP
jgi:hypothetical protein